MIKEKLIKIECNENGEAVITSLLEPDLSVFSKEELEILKASKEKLLDKTDKSVFRLVVLASKRALEISDGQPKLTDALPITVKPSTIALQEIIEGKVKAK